MHAHPIGCDIKTEMAVVCLTVSPVVDPKSRTEWHKKIRQLKIGRKERNP